MGVSPVHFFDQKNAGETPMPLFFSVSSSVFFVSSVAPPARDIHNSRCGANTPPLPPVIFRRRKSHACMFASTIFLH